MSWCHREANPSNFLDAANFENSPFFDPSSAHGVGTWGDPNNDYQIHDGGFKNVKRVYPSPHNIRRRFWLFPFTNPAAAAPWGNASDAPPPDTTFEVNTTITQANVDSVVNGYVGNYTAMQAYIDTTNVGSPLLSPVPR